MPELIADLKLLGTVSDTYADVFPDIAATLRNSVKTGNTLLEKEKTLNAFLDDVSSFSDTANAFLDENGDNLVRLGQVSEQQLALLARYSPEFPCLLDGIVRQAPRLADTFRGFVFHINLHTIPKQPRGYTPADSPKYADARRPYCGTLPTPPYSPKHPKPSMPDFADGVKGGNNLKRVAPSFDRAGGHGHPAGQGAHGVADGAGARGPCGPGGRPLHADVRSAGTRVGGERAMSFLDKKTRGDGVKLMIFMMVTTLATGMLVVLIGNITFQSTRTYKAEFSDATGVVKGDDIRIAGVKVGSVKKVEITKRTHALVTFSSPSGPPSPSPPRRRSATATWSASATSR